MVLVGDVVYWFITTGTPKVCKIMALRAIFKGFRAIILHTLGV